LGIPLYHGWTPLLNTISLLPSTTIERKKGNASSVVLFACSLPASIRDNGIADRSGKIGECPAANAHAISASAAFPIGRLVGGETPCHIVIRHHRLVAIHRRHRPQGEVTHNHREVFHRHHQDHRRAGRLVRQERVDTEEHVELTQGVSILVCTDTPMYG
jgi:hypothetical protein